MLQEGREKRDTLREMYDKYEGWISVGGTDSRVSAQCWNLSVLKQRCNGFETLSKELGCSTRVVRVFNETNTCSVNGTTAVWFIQAMGCCCYCCVKPKSCQRALVPPTFWCWHNGCW